MKLSRVLFFLFVCSQSVVAANDPLRVLLLTGGCCHDYPRQKEILPQGISARTTIPIEWTVLIDNNAKMAVHKVTNWADGYDVVVHNQCHADLKDKEWVEKILKPHKAGVPAVTIHCAMHRRVEDLRNNCHHRRVFW